MSAEKVTAYLLTHDTNLNAVVPAAQVYAGEIPLGATLPAIAYNLVSSVEDTAVGLTTLKVRSRVQITIASTTYPVVKQVRDLVIAACNHKRGTFNGVKVDSVVRDVVGPDFRDDEAGIYYQTVDFRIIHDD